MVFRFTFHTIKISPIGFDKKFDTFNVNADTMSGKVASSVLSERLVLLTDVDGVLDKKGNLVSELSTTEAKKLIQKWYNL